MSTLLCNRKKGDEVLDGSASGSITTTPSSPPSLKNTLNGGRLSTTSIIATPKTLKTPPRIGTPSIDGLIATPIATTSRKAPSAGSPNRFTVLIMFSQWSIGNQLGLLSLVLWVVSVVVYLGTQQCCSDRSDPFVVVGTKALLGNSTAQYNNNLAAFPKLAWLMSFPNSGTSYTLRIVRQVSQTTTATNYGSEHVNNVTGTTFLFDGLPHKERGPFRANPRLALPDSYLLTKTHCGSRCVHCAPHKYLETPRTFERACRLSKRIDNFTKMSASHVRYSARDLVKRTVHLIRNPLDNVVSRFHLGIRHEQKRLNESLFLATASAMEEGDAEGVDEADYDEWIFVDEAVNATHFARWCKELDELWKKLEKRTVWFDDSILDGLEGVPCHAEFFKWIQWHNMAYTTAKVTLDVPQLVLYYEDYERDWKGTVSGLLKFLELPHPRFGLASPFSYRSYYQEYYTREQRHKIRSLIREVATAAVWDLISHYFEGDDY